MNEKVKISYVNLHGRKYVDLKALIEKLREIAGNPEQVTVDLEKLADWLEQAEYPEPVQYKSPDTI